MQLRDVLCYEGHIKTVLCYEGHIKTVHTYIAERFHVNAIFLEKFHESIWHRLEKHFSSLNNALRRYLVVRRFPKPRSKFNFV